MTELPLNPITPAIGAEIDGVQLGDALADPSLADLLKPALDQHQVLVFRNQVLDREAHKAVGRLFGQLHVHPSKRLPGAKGDPEIFSVKAGPDTRLNNGGLWHMDLSCEPVPLMASVLRMVDLPSNGGDTLFASMHAAYCRLSEPIQQMLCRLEAVHDGRIDLRRYGIELAAGQSYPMASHPVVASHATTGRPTLFVNRAFTSHIEGLSELESNGLLEMLYYHIASDHSIQCRVRWAPGTVVIWDNQATQHYAVWDYYPSQRHAERVSIVGTGPPQAYRPHQPGRPIPATNPGG